MFQNYSLFKTLNVPII